MLCSTKQKLFRMKELIPLLLPWHGKTSNSISTVPGLLSAEFVQVAGFFFSLTSLSKICWAPCNNNKDRADLTGLQLIFLGSYLHLWSWQPSSSVWKTLAPLVAPNVTKSIMWQVFATHFIDTSIIFNQKPKQDKMNKTRQTHAKPEAAVYAQVCQGAAE